MYFGIFSGGVGRSEFDGGIAFDTLAVGLEVLSVNQRLELAGRLVPGRRWLSVERGRRSFTRCDCLG